MCFPTLSQRDEKRCLEILYSAHKRGVLPHHSRGKKQGKDQLNSHFQRAVYCVIIEIHLNYFEIEHSLNVIFNVLL